jgi:hypothetical protein
MNLWHKCNIKLIERKWLVKFLTISKNIWIPNCRGLIYQTCINTGVINVAPTFNNMQIYNAFYITKPIGGLI